jgi:hypothetical protein
LFPPLEVGWLKPLTSTEPECRICSTLVDTDWRTPSERLTGQASSSAHRGVAAGSSWVNAGWLTPALTLPLSEPAVLHYGLKAMFDPSSPLCIQLSANPQLLRFLVGFARHCTPGKWREAMEVFTEVNRAGMDAYDELAEGGNLLSITRQTTTTTAAAGAYSPVNRSRHTDPDDL